VSTDKSKTVLLVDDDNAILVLLETAFTKAGYRMVTTLDSEFGLRIAHEMAPSVVVMDIMMPKIDGWAFIDALRKDPVNANTPVVVITAHREGGVEERAKTAGVFGLMFKPLNLADLITMVGNALRSVEDAPARAT
jgi:two-component system, chemotaxis family, chemotaxis protein CheY